MVRVRPASPFQRWGNRGWKAWVSAATAVPCASRAWFLGPRGCGGTVPASLPALRPPGVQLLNIRGQDAAAVLGMPATCPVAPR